MTSNSLAQSELPDYPVECTFSVNFQGYTCALHDVELMTPNVNIIFEGEHIDNRTDADVVVVDIFDSMTPFIIQTMFTQFPNLRVLEIYRTSVSYLEFPEAENMREITIVGGMIPRLENSTFSGLRNLDRLSIRNSQIAEIEEEAFAGLTNLRHLSLIGNEIARIPTRALHDVPNVTWIDFENNNLTRVEASSFAESRNLVSLYLERNHIIEVEGNFSEAFRDTISIVNMFGNLCSRRTFNNFNSGDRDAEFVLFNMAMSNCFNNFVSGPEGARRVTLTVEGPMSFFDAFGNLVLRVN